MNEEQLFNLTFDVKSINIILAGLGKLPLETGLQVFDNIHKQINEQKQQFNSEDSQLKDKIIK